MKIELGARVRTRDGHDVGDVHRVVVDLDQKAVVSIVVLKGRLLSRDILVPIDFAEAAYGKQVTLRLRKDELDQLPDFAFNEFLTPPPTWALAVPILPGGAIYIPVHQRERLGPSQDDITPGTKVQAKDGEVGVVEEVELDPRTARLDAFWIRAGKIFPHDVRIPAEWVVDYDGRTLYLAASKGEIERLLGSESKARRRA